MWPCCGARDRSGGRQCLVEKYARTMDGLTAEELLALAERLRDRSRTRADVLDAIDARYPEMLAALDWLCASGPRG